MTRLPIDDEHAPLYSVGQVASMLQLPQAFLRRLDDQQVVCPRRSPGGQRRYSRSEIGRVQRVSALVGEGLSVAAAARIISLEQQVADLERQLDELRRRLRQQEDAAPTEQDTPSPA